MSAKQTASSLIGQLDDNASWGDVMGTIAAEYKRETGDAKADAVAAVALCAIFVTTCILWVGGQ